MGQEAVLKASDNACTRAFMGEKKTARKWRRVMILIAEEFPVGIRLWVAKISAKAGC